MEIERIETRWVSPQIEEYAESLRREIAKEMAIPAYLLRPETFQEAQRKAMRRTELMQRELARIINEFSYPVFIARLPQSSAPGQ